MRKIFKFLARLFRSLKALALKYVAPSVQVVQALKEAVESPVAPLITSLIPGNIDDKIVARLRIELPRILQILRISDECLKLEQPQEILLCAITKLREYNPEARAAQYHSIAALLSVSLSDKKITWREAVHLAEEIFQQSKTSENGI